MEYVDFISISIFFMIGLVILMGIGNIVNGRKVSKLEIEVNYLKGMVDHLNHRITQMETNKSGWIDK